jgi:hypothetical protein
MSMTMKTIGAVALIVAGLMHCGPADVVNTDQAASCTGQSAAGRICIEFTGAQAPALAQSACEAGAGQGLAGGTAAVEACSRTGIVGGCRMSYLATTAVAWSYGSTTELVRTYCTSQGGSYVAP